jgi:hypothetical protein
MESLSLVKNREIACVGQFERVNLLLKPVDAEGVGLAVSQSSELFAQFLNFGSAFDQTRISPRKSGTEPSDLCLGELMSVGRPNRVDPQSAVGVE